jgi:hypothetical protein
MYLRAEERHRAEIAAGELTEIVTPAVPDVFITTSAVLESIGSPAAPLPASALAPDTAPPRIEAAPEIEPPWVSEIELTAASLPVATLPIQPTIQLARASAGQPRERVARALVPGAALATIAVASIFGIASSVWPSGETDALEEKQSAAITAPVRSAPVPSAGVAAASATTTPAVPVSVDRHGVTAIATGPATQPAGTAGLANVVRQPVVRTPEDAPTGTPVHTASEGQLRITSTPSGARVTVNGIGWGQTPLTVGHLPLGTKTVRLTRDGYASQERVVDLSGNDGSAALNVALQRAR